MTNATNAMTNATSAMTLGKATAGDAVASCLQLVTVKAHASV
ncbi:MAG: hypothetical protein ACO1RT_03570 [Planctomycetaceae bacterium]